MKNIEIIRHGEVILKEDTLPSGAVLEKETNREIIAHSETGHHHILETLDMSKFKIYSFNGERYVEIPEISKLWHQKTGNDVHKPHAIKPSVYKIIIKKEYDYFLKKLRQVRD